MATPIGKNSLLFTGNTNLRKYADDLILSLARIIIPKGASVENGQDVFNFYKPLWVNMLSEQKSINSKIFVIFTILKAALGIHKNYYIFGDFEGKCLRQRLLNIFRRGS